MSISKQTFRSGPWKELFAQAVRVGDVLSECGVRQEAYGGPSEVSQTLVQVAALALPDLKIEIKCVAHL